MTSKMHRYSTRLGDGTVTCYEPTRPRRNNTMALAKLSFIAVLFALALWKILPVTMVIIKALGEML